MSNRIHHAAIVVADVEASLRFWRDGLGFEVLLDDAFEGDWKGLFGVDSTRVRSVMLGNAEKPTSGVVELVQFEGADVPTGFRLLSMFVKDLDAAVERLGATEVRRIEVESPNGPVAMATVRDPDGLLVELIGPPRGG